MKSLVINFSGRNNGNCANVSKVIQKELENVSVINFSDVNIFSCSNCDYECFKNENCPYIIDDLFDIYNQIVSSDFVYYVVPNYCGYPCANFFIFNERSCCYFKRDRELLNKYLSVNKKFIIISNSNQDSFKEICKYQVNNEPDILFLSTRKYNQNSIEGILMENEDAKYELISFIHQ